MVDEVKMLLGAVPGSGYSTGMDSASDAVMALVGASFTPEQSNATLACLSRLALAPALRVYADGVDTRTTDAPDPVDGFGVLASYAMPHGVIAGLYTALTSEAGRVALQWLFVTRSDRIRGALSGLGGMFSAGRGATAVGAVLLACTLRRLAAARGEAV